MRQIEILAPAGSYEGMTAAINASCDAIYIGGNKFGARAYADNPDEEILLRAIDYAHIHNKKIYMTVNTLLKSRELERDLYDYLRRYYEQGLDAVIVQDVGAMYYIQKHFPDLPIHASTQMTLTMAQGAEVLKPMGITRLVNSRELSLEEIKSIRANTDLEIESFVHGALCYCYSGQCLMSSIFGGRSGNRGRCAQPCRMPYQLFGDGKNLMKNQEEKYLLSPKDICTVDMIPDLIDVGIDSFKIEGRMKRPEYAAGVTYVYRKYSDKYLELGRERYEAYQSDHVKELKQDILLLQDLYNRGGFTNGYYNNRNGKSMISAERPNHSGVNAGVVKEVKGSQARIRLSEAINAQDILEIRCGAEILYEFTVKNGEEKGRDYTVNLNKGSKVKPGHVVYRTKNNSLLEELGERYLKDEKKEMVHGELIITVGEKLHLKLESHNTLVELEGDLAEEAKNQPMTEEKIRKQMMKTNDTSYIFKDLVIKVNGDVFIPVQKLNELRREGLNSLSKSIAVSYRRKVLEENIKQEEEYSKLLQSQLINRKEPYEPRISVEVNSMQQLKAACSQQEVTNIYLNSDMVPITKILELTQYCKQNNKKCYIILPHIFRESTYHLFLQHKNIWMDDTIDGYIIQNLEEYTFVNKELQYSGPCKEVIINYNLYVMNRQAMMFWREMGISQFTAPLELNQNELKELSGSYTDFIVYGRIPLMVSAQCLVKTASGNERDCNGHNIEKIELIDRYQKSFPVVRHCRDCYNTIYNCQNLSLLSNSEEVKAIKPKNIRLNFTLESFEETKRVLNSYVQAYLYNKKNVEDIEDFTRGHFKRGVE